jgi:hypothetical protein
MTTIFSRSTVLSGIRKIYVDVYLIYTVKKVKISLFQAMEAHRVARG